MEDNKQLGAKVMFDQSIVYLYNAYREQGLSHSDAQKRVADDIESVSTKHARSGILSSAFAPDAKKIMEGVISDIEGHYKGAPPLQIRRSLQQLRELIKRSN